MTGKTERCGWHFRYPEEVAYHDTRWCQPVHDDQELFALLCLEGQQAGLSWSLILRREAAIRKAFDDFDPRRIAQWDEAKIRQLRQDPSIIRSEAKIRAALVNARAFLAVQREFGSFDRYLWGFVAGR
jgi:DNA-3-methyladenine glycosylase I